MLGCSAYHGIQAFVAISAIASEAANRKNDVIWFVPEVTVAMTINTQIH